MGTSLALLLLQLGPPPRVTLGDFAFLAGRWAGTLDYLDYADDRTRQTLQAFLDCTVTDTAIAYRFSYIEPNGKRVTGDEVRLTVAAGGQGVRLGADEWRVGGAADSVVLLREGEDAGRAAEFRRIFAGTGDRLVIRTEVRPRGRAEWFVRNRHQLVRLSP
jgi:hypothetical protein